MRTYNVRMIALVVRAPIKWVDNILSHHRIPGVVAGTRGVERRVSDDGLLCIELCRLLTHDLGVPLGRAAAIAQQVVAREPEARKRLPLGSGIVLELPMDEIDQRLRTRLIDAAEAVAQVRRGRPPKRARPLPQ